MPGEAVSLPNACRSCRAIARFVPQQCARRSHQFAWCVCRRFWSYLRCASGLKVLRCRVYWLFLSRLSTVNNTSTAIRPKCRRRTMPAEKRMFAHSGHTSRKCPKKFSLVSNTSNDKTALQIESNSKHYS